jgi:formylmethanofuran dehydrogenase subunit A
LDCLHQPSSGIIPTYVHIKVSELSPAASFTKIKAQKLKIKDKLRFLHTEKQKLNKLFYNIHLELSRFCNNTWYSTEKDINDKLEFEKQDG